MVERVFHRLARMTGTVKAFVRHYTSRLISELLAFSFLIIIDPHLDYPHHYRFMSTAYQSPEQDSSTMKSSRKTSTAPTSTA